MGREGSQMERLGQTSPATPDGKLLQQAVLALLEHNDLSPIMDPQVKLASEAIITRSQLMNSQRGLQLIEDVQAMWAKAEEQDVAWVNVDACISLIKLDAGDSLDQALPPAERAGGRIWL